MKEKAVKRMKITKGMMDKLIQEAELHLVGLFSSGKILEVMELLKHLILYLMELGLKNLHS